MSITNSSSTTRVDYVDALANCNRRRNALQNEITRFQVMLEQSNSAREELKQLCRERFGTDDMDKLRQIAQSMKEQDVTNVTNYMKTIENVAEALSQIKRAMEG